MYPIRMAHLETADILDILDILTSYGRQGVHRKSGHLRHLDILRENTRRRHLDILTSYGRQGVRRTIGHLRHLDILTENALDRHLDILASWHLDILRSIRCPPTNPDILTS